MLTGRRVGIVCSSILGAALWIGCSEQAEAPRASKTATAPAAAGDQAAGKPPAGELSGEALIEAGRVSYNANCIACHSMDPSQDGALGPAVSGASPELLEARVLRAEYPEGYTPKRNTRVMVALPHLERQLPALTAFLDSLE